MDITKIDIPLTLPFDVPALAHPPLVHFAIVLPIIILVIELVNIFMKKKALSGTTFSMLVVLVVVLLGAFFTGKADGSAAYMDMSGDAKAVLKEHKLLGTYLFYAAGLLLLLKVLNLTKKGFIKAIYIVGLIAFVGVTLEQGKEGGELVFKHGTSIEAMKKANDEIFDLKDDMGDLEEEVEELTEEFKELKDTQKNEDEESSEKEDDTNTTSE
jgi:uncharacterized membrane protein